MAPITQLQRCAMKIEHIQLKSPNINPYHNLRALKETFHPLLRANLSFGSPILKRDAMDKNHCTSQ